jgi:deoxyribodipyrimidine photolyase
MREKFLMPENTINIVWFKRDLRLSDHEPLLKASQNEANTLWLYIFEPSVMNKYDSDIRHWRFVSESLLDLNNSVKNYGSEILMKLILSLKNSRKTLTSKIIFLPRNWRKSRTLLLNRGKYQFPEQCRALGLGSAFDMFLIYQL